MDHEIPPNEGLGQGWGGGGENISGFLLEEVKIPANFQKETFRFPFLHTSRSKSEQLGNVSVSWATYQWGHWGCCEAKNCNPSWAKVWGLGGVYVCLCCLSHSRAIPIAEQRL